MKDFTFYMRCQEGSVYNDKDQLELGQYLVLQPL